MESMKIKNIAAAGSLLVILGAASTLAYFTSADTVTNRFTVGEVSIEVREENYDSVTDKNMAYGQLLNKDPEVYNKGKNDALVFIEVTVPKEEAVLVSNDGKTLNAKQNVPLFDFISTASNNAVLDNKTYDGSSSDIYFQYNKMWIPLTSVGEKTYPIDNSGSIVYAFGYSEVVRPGTASEPLFDQIKLKNIYESSTVIGNKDIKIEAYGIQAEEIPELYTNTTPKTKKSLNEKVLSSVFYEYFKKESDSS